MHFKFLFVCLLLSACASTQRSETDPVELSTAKSLTNLRSELLAWADKCEGHPSKGDCDDGDMTLFNGILCSSGEAAGCDAVRLSQGPDGQLWRSPRRVGKDTKNAASRDMGLGGLLYVAATKDVAWANRWVAYIKANKKLCTNADDNRCNLTTTYVGFHNYLADKIGFSKLSHGLVRDREAVMKSLAGNVPPIDPKASALDRVWAVLEPVTPSGYALHLLSVQLYAKALVGDWNSTLQWTAERMMKRDPQNVWFMYIAKGKDEDVGKKVLELAPTSKPARTHQWSLERSDAEAAWLSSCGWDFIAMTNLLLK